MCGIVTLNFSMGFNIVALYMVCVTHKWISPSLKWQSGNDISYTNWNTKSANEPCKYFIQMNIVPGSCNDLGLTETQVQPVICKGCICDYLLFIFDT